MGIQHLLNDAITEEIKAEAEKFGYAYLKVEDLADIFECSAREMYELLQDRSQIFTRKILAGQKTVIASIQKSVMDNAINGSTPALTEALKLIKKYHSDLKLNYAEINPEITTGAQ
jgi:hypothetical protein